VSPSFSQHHNLHHDLSQWYICSRDIVTCYHREPGYQLLGKAAETIHFPECVVGICILFHRYFTFSDSLCLIVIIALPIATPFEYRNTANFALGGFTNCMYPLPVKIATYDKL
jgi:hypothetical protein